MSQTVKRVKLFSVTIHDCEVDTFRSGGKGGQNQNKRDTGVRVRHVLSGAVAESREERSQHLNKQKAFRKMAESKAFQTWAKTQAAKLNGFDPDAEVDKAMQPENLKVECRDDLGVWSPYEETNGNKESSKDENSGTK